MEETFNICISFLYRGLDGEHFLLSCSKNDGLIIIKSLSTTSHSSYLLFYNPLTDDVSNNFLNSLHHNTRESSSFPGGDSCPFLPPFPFLLIPPTNKKMENTKLHPSIGSTRARTFRINGSREIFITPHDEAGSSQQRDTYRVCYS